MNSSEEAVFAEALDIADPLERASYLERACGSDAALRASVESLLASYAAGSFLEIPVVPSPMGEPGDQGEAVLGNATQAEAESRDDEATSLEFLTPSTKPGSLGRLAHYEIMEVVGQGGMGIVLRAFDEKLHRVVAIKVMAASLAATSPPRKRFLREARAAAAVRHDHVVDIHTVEEQPIPYLVMEYVPGETLQQKLDRVGPLETPEVLRLGQQIARGLAAAHAQGLIHRDIKPSNILLEKGAEDRVKITDFGLARAADDVSLTQSGVIAGTPMYMAPEQTMGETIDHRADLFSLGSVLYTICSGRPPFRATSSMATLKRVAEDTPRPIREIIPEVPDWLCDIIAKLHSKKPEDRFQSAQEVAELLGKCLTELQHGQAISVKQVAGLNDKPDRWVARPEQREGRGGFASSSTPFEDSGRATRRRRWAVAAAALLCLIGSLSLTEATGVTNLRATVIRILTPDGTLVVETDDPAVKVTVEGDGGLVITGAGLEEIRLRPGSYRVQADRDGKPVALDKDLVTVARGGRAIVKVKLERAKVQEIAKGEQGAFVLLAAGKERKFDTLAEAVQGASDGDTIEIRGNGPFVTKPIVIDRRRLTFRAGKGFWPVIKADPDEQGSNLLDTNASLAVEGLEFQWVNALALDAAQPEPNRLIFTRAATSRLHVANCRFVMNRRKGLHNYMACIAGWRTAYCHLQNCQFLIGGHGTIHGSNVMFQASPHAELLLENCLLVGHGASLTTHAEPIKAVLKRNTFLGFSQFVKISLAKKFDPPQGEKTFRPIQVETSANIFDGIMLFHLGALIAEKELSVAETQKVLTNLVSWREDGNLYLMPKDQDLLWLGKPLPEEKHFMVPSVVPTKTMADWKSFWGMDKLNSRRGKARFQGGDPVTKAKLTPELLSTDDFRLRPDSDGYRAGKDGKDLGADVDLVGPGPAYERWKKTPEYQQWLKDTKQATNAEAPTAESKAFVLLTGKGVEVRKFDTLAEAVQSASDGDTIEIRGNGPFVCDGVTIRHPLVIRAGAGYTPRIKLSKASADSNFPLITALDALVLEGLELRRTGGAAKQVEDRLPHLLFAWQRGSLHVANCRLIYKGDSPQWEQGRLIASQAKSLSVRNSVLSGNISTESGALCVSGVRHTIENCVCAVGGIGFSLADPEVRDVNIRVRGNTLVGNCLNLTLFGKPNLSKAGEATPPIRLEFSGNVARWDEICRNQCFLFFHQAGLKEPLSAVQAEAFLPRLVALYEKKNVYRTGTPMIQFVAEWTFLKGARGRDLAAWDRFWSQKNTGSVEGEMRFQGGDLVTRARSAPEQLTANDFRLRRDSAGYRAGKDGKDLGADVDLVGPGPAYERWKKTAEYQQWLKDTGQRK